MLTEPKKCKLNRQGFCPVCKRQVKNFKSNIQLVRDCQLSITDNMALIITRDGNPCYFKDIFKGQSTFIICSGPSLKSIDLDFLNKRGFHSSALNNIAAKNIRPNFWFCVDQPENFHEVIWKDPTIWKFVPEGMSGKPIKVGKEQKYGNFACRMNSNVWAYPLREQFDSRTYIQSDEVHFGRSKGDKDDLGIAGGRSVMLAAFKLLMYMGFKNVYLLGCDFLMNPDEQYAFEQRKDHVAQATNNSAYDILAKRFEALQPRFLKIGFNVFNCNLESRLRTFPFLPVEQAIEKYLKDIAFPQYNISLKGMYK